MRLLKSYYYAIISDVSKMFHVVHNCYTDLSSAVLSKLIFGKAAEALLAGLDSEEADSDAVLPLTISRRVREQTQLLQSKLPMGWEIEI